MIMRTIQKTSLKNLRNLRKLMSLASLISLISLTSLHAQVKIGQDAEPKKGTVLELNSNPAGYIGGLRLTNVSLASITDLTPFSETPEGAMVAGKFVSEDFKGAIVYNTNITLKNEAGEITGIGVYYWEGSKWVKDVSAAIEPWYKMNNPGNPSTKNTDDSYLMAKVAIGTNQAASINNGTNNAQLTVVGGDACINEITVGTGGTSNMNTVVGQEAFKNAHAGEHSTTFGNTAIGYYSLHKTTGNSTVAVGQMTGANLTSTFNTVAIGYNALSNVNYASGTVAIGSSALSNASGDQLYNTAVGDQAMRNNKGTYNTAVGRQALRCSSGSYNTALGYGAGQTTDNSGSYNTIIGYTAGNSITSGSENTVLGSIMSNITTGDRNTVIGHHSSVKSETESHQISIHNLINATGATGVITGGVGAGNVGIGTNNPSAKLHIKTAETGNGFRLEDGTQQPNYVLTTTNGDGVGTWQPAQVVEPWYDRETKTQAYSNTRDAYLKANVAIGFNAENAADNGFPKFKIANPNTPTGKTEQSIRLQVQGNAFVSNDLHIHHRMGIGTVGGQTISNDTTIGFIPGAELHLLSNDPKHDEEKGNRIHIETIRTSEKVTGDHITPTLHFLASRGVRTEYSDTQENDVLGRIAFSSRNTGGIKSTTGNYGTMASIVTTYEGNNTARLDVNATGDINLTAAGVTRVNGNLLVSGLVNGTTVGSSDSRLKTNITPSKYGLSEILKLNPVNYEMKDKPGVERVGFIAQEVKPIIPDVVFGTEGDLEKGETLSIAYSDFAPVLTKAIQEQQAQIEALQGENKTLLNFIEQLEARLKALETAK